MNELSLLPDYAGIISEVFLPFLRVGALFMVIPILGTRLVPQNIRLILTVTATIAIYPQVPEFVAPDPGTLSWLIVGIKEILIGLLLGFIVQLLFQLLVIGGQTMAMQSGLGFAQLMDPVNGVNVASISQLYLLMANIFFFSSNGHLAVIQVLSETFQSYPVAGALWPEAAFMNVAKLGGWMFSSGLLIALPAVVSLLLLNITFGVISRLAPQFNVFSFGFAFIVVSGVVIVMVTLPRILPKFDVLTRVALVYMRQYLGS